MSSYLTYLMRNNYIFINYEYLTEIYNNNYYYRIKQELQSNKVKNK